jgi:phosphohistidine phosphatase
MKTLLILRHAKSSWGDASLPDHDRPLNKRGKRAAPRVGQMLREKDLVPDLILTSTARRARETAESVADESGYGGVIEVCADFYPGTPLDYIWILRNLPDEQAEQLLHCIMVVGHNPGFEELLATLTDETPALPTATLAQVELPIAHWNDLSEETAGKLIFLWTPPREE